MCDYSDTAGMRSLQQAEGTTSVPGVRGDIFSEAGASPGGEKRLRTPGSSTKKMAAPCKRLKGEDDRMNSTSDLDEDELLNISPLLGSEEDEGMEDISVELGGGGAGGPEEAEKIADDNRGAEVIGDGKTRIMESRKRDGVDLEARGKIKRIHRERSPQLVLIKKGKSQDLTLQEHRDLIRNLDDQIFSGRYERDPRIDWASWKERSMIGCQDEFTVSWIKGMVHRLMPNFRAWEVSELQFEAKYTTTVLMPTGSRPAEKIMERVIEGNGLQGEFAILNVKRKESSMTMVVGVDRSLEVGLETLENWVYCGVMRLAFRKVAERMESGVVGGSEKCYWCMKEGHISKNCEERSGMFSLPPY